jgi:hypothetical protein
LVCLGSFAVRQDALQLQAKARDAGIARDVYVKRFAE